MLTVISGMRMQILIKAYKPDWAVSTTNKHCWKQQLPDEAVGEWKDSPTKWQWKRIKSDSFLRIRDAVWLLELGKERAESQGQRERSFCKGINPWLQVKWLQCWWGCTQAESAQSGTTSLERISHGITAPSSVPLSGFCVLFSSTLPEIVFLGLGVS